MYQWKYQKQFFLDVYLLKYPLFIAPSVINIVLLSYLMTLGLSLQDCERIDQQNYKSERVFFELPC